ncbi:hypothetical protein CEXT_612251 [Caerostris extrusa]|uniref:PWWP domain-containing protein n=1 Tax=Caerostris extrusa TaxID=172846 RepID=A0AAV4P5A6_CAEEX|nr:hypothetical protein CEXT_612251 [Caerostris extrusa]
MALNEYVWAKMKYFPAWPGKVTRHPDGIKKKGCAYVFFYGTHDFAFINEANIVPFNSALPKQHRLKKYKDAVEELQTIIEDPSKEICKNIPVCKVRVRVLKNKAKPLSFTLKTRLRLQTRKR